MENFVRPGAFLTGQYQNVFAELGYRPAEIETRKNAIFDTLFYGSTEERLYHPVGEDMACFEDTGNHDARTEGMSYAMMLCVQMDHRPEFDRLQKFFCETVKQNDRAVYTVEGKILPASALHPVAITATNAQASLAATGPYAEECVRRFWQTPLRTGPRRYYDNCLYAFAFLALSGNYRIY